MRNSLRAHPATNKQQFPLFIPQNFSRVQQLQSKKMRQVTKLIKDHKKLVLGSTGKNNFQNKVRQSNEFQKFIRSQSQTVKIHQEHSRERTRQLRHSTAKLERENSENQQVLLKVTGEGEIQANIKHFRTQVQKRDKLILRNIENNSSPSVRGKQLYPRRTSDRLFQPTDLNGFDFHTLEVVGHLREHGVLSISGEASFIIKRDDIAELLTNMTVWVVRASCRDTPPKSTCSQFNKILTKLMDKIQKDIRQRHKSKLRINCKTTDLSYIPESLQQINFEEKKQIISILTYQQKRLKESIQNLKFYQQSIKSQCKSAQSMIEKKKRELEELHRSTLQVEKALNGLKGLAKQEQNEYTKLLVRYQKIKNFISQQQNNQIIKDIFDEYKEIQADIYEYAAYLQSNQLASDLFYEPHPFRAIEEQVEEELKTVNTMIIQNKETPVEEKAVMMRDFVLDSMGKFKKKDEEMSKILDFKTKCIQKFIENMKKWLNNWQFKQEFLVNLRKQFAFDSNQIMQILEKIQYDALSKIQLENLKDLSIKIIENYKMGNSFY